MKEYIEKIIEIVLEDVSCGHQEIEEYPRGPKIEAPTYCLNDPLAVIEKCIKAIPARLIERPEITDEWTERKAKQLHDNLWGISSCDSSCSRIKEIMGFLTMLLNELSAKINLIGSAPVKKRKEGCPPDFIPGEDEDVG